MRLDCETCRGNVEIRDGEFRCVMCGLRMGQGQDLSGYDI